MSSRSPSTTSERSAARLMSTGEQQIRSTLVRLGYAETGLGPVSATIARRLEEVPLADLPELTRHSAQDFVSVRELGRGGMGVVHVAQQRSIGREVALKTSIGNDPRLAAALVREARVMGMLEHPSMVPVHALALGEGGEPVLVMKRIAGTSWRALLDDPESAAWRPLVVGHGDRLRANVEILVQLCRALSFAHEHGVIHRDLKPENVMIGRHGEVLLLDWGVALVLADRDREPEAIVGTPGYMAPEMARGDPRQTDARTDVYLLGARRFEILTGRMTHEAPPALGALASALLSEPPVLPGNVPAELAALVTRACALDPAARPASAESFREGLAHFLASRDADALVENAREALERGIAAMASEGPTSPGAARALIEARFGLLAALRMRPSDARTQRELDRALEAAAGREMALRNPDAARSVLAEMHAVPAALGARLGQLEQELAAERAAAEARVAERRDADAAGAVRPLTWIALAATLIGTSIGLWFAVPAAADHVAFPARVAIGIDILGVAVGLTGYFFARRALLATAGTRRLAAFYGFWGWSLLLSDAVSYSLGADAAEAAAHGMACSAFVSAMAGVQLREIRPAVLVNACAAILIVIAPIYSAIFAMVALTIDVAIFIRAFRLEGTRSRTSETPG